MVHNKKDPRPAATGRGSRTHEGIEYMNTVHQSADIELTREQEQLLAGARPTWATESEVDVEIFSEGNRYGFVYSAKFGAAEWGVIYNPHTGTYTTPTGYTGENEDLSLADLTKLADDLQQLLTHLRAHGVTA